MEVQRLNRVEYPRVGAISFKGCKSRVQKQFQKEADINNIIKKYAKTGLLCNPLDINGRKPMFGDFSSYDFANMQSVVSSVNNQFSNLPLAIRKRFEYNPVSLIEFLANPANLEESVKLGLRDKSVLPTKAPEAPVVTPKEGV